MFVRGLTGLLVLLIACASCSRAPAPGPAPLLAAQAAEEASTRDEWQKVLISGQPAGYIRTTERPREGGGVRTTTAQMLILKRGQEALRTESSTTIEEDAAGRITGFALHQALSKDALEVKGTLEGEQFDVVETVAGQGPRRSRIPAEPRALGPHAIDRLLRETLKKPGDVLEARTFIPELRKFCNQRAVYVQVEETALPGRRASLERISITVDALPNVTTIQWLDDRGLVQKSSISMLGLEITTYLSSAREILAEKFTSPPEVFLSTSVPVKGRVDARAKSITYRIESKSGEKVFDASRRKPFPASGQEETRAGTATERWVRIRRVAPPPAPTNPQAVPLPESLAENLRPNSFVQSDDEAIRTAASKAAGGESDPWKKAVRIERWVYDTVAKKSLGTAFASAKEVLTQREGDCTEHAVLLAALLRAEGLPSRVVAGLVHHEGAFVGHMWTEVHVNGWVPLDATRAAGSVDPDHIGLSVSSLDAASVAELFLDIVPVVGNVRIEVVELET